MTVHKRIGERGVEVHRTGWFYWHPRMKGLVGQKVKVTRNSGDQGAVEVVLGNGERFDAMLSRCIRNEHKLEPTGSAKKIIEVYDRALARIGKCSQDPMSRKIARKASRDAQTIKFLIEGGK